MKKAKHENEFNCHFTSAQTKTTGDDDYDNDVDYDS